MSKYVQNGHGSYHQYLVVEKTSVLEAMENYRKSIKVN